MIPFRTKKAVFLITTEQGEVLNILVEFQGFSEDDRWGLGCMVLKVEGRPVKLSTVTVQSWLKDRALTTGEEERIGTLVLREALEKIGIRATDFTRIHGVSVYG